MAPRTRGIVQPSHPAEDGGQDTAELHSGNSFAELANKHWLKSTKKGAKVKVKPDVVKKEVWDVLEKDDFPYRCLLELENLQILEK
jgi:intron-binding protein aquarius